MLNPAPLSAQAQALIDPWPGPYGGLPPLAGVEPLAIEEAVRAALNIKRAEVQAVSTNPAAASFQNTIEALEDCGHVLERVVCVYTVYSNSLSLNDMPATAQRIAPLLPALDDEIAHDDRLFARVQAVWLARATLAPEQQRLTKVCLRATTKTCWLKPNTLCS
jgi:peptidyl-dipeptidase Dcp